MKSSRFWLLPLVLVATGCATTQDETVPSSATKGRDTTVVWGNEGRGGASQRIPGYVHALAKETRFRPVATAMPAPAPAPTAAPTAPPVPTTVVRAPSPGMASVEDVMARAVQLATETPTPQPVVTARAPVVVAKADPLWRAWEKYCDGGEGMTEEDWELVNAAGAPDGIPADLSDDCAPPK